MMLAKMSRGGFDAQTAEELQNMGPSSPEVQRQWKYHPFPVELKKKHRDTIGISKKNQEDTHILILNNRVWSVPF